MTCNDNCLALNLNSYYCRFHFKNYLVSPFWLDHYASSYIYMYIKPMSKLYAILSEVVNVGAVSSTGQLHMGGY